MPSPITENCLKTLVEESLKVSVDAAVAKAVDYLEPAVPLEDALHRCEKLRQLFLDQQAYLGAYVVNRAYEQLELMRNARRAIQRTGD